MTEPPASYRDEFSSVEDALSDALSGWRYLRENSGDLYGVGWDRVETKLIEALAEIRSIPERSGGAA